MKMFVLLRKYIGKIVNNISGHGDEIVAINFTTSIPNSHIKYVFIVNGSKN